VIGAVLIAIVVLVVLPALFFATYGLVSLLLSWLMTDNAEITHAGSELIETNI
jgi:hypothetical protein